MWESTIAVTNWRACLDDCIFLHKSEFILFQQLVIFLWINPHCVTHGWCSVVQKRLFFFCKNNLYCIWTIEPFDKIALRVLSFSKWVWREDIRTFLQCSDVPSLTNLNRSSENCHLSTFPSLVFQCLFLKMQVAICRQRISVHCSLSSNRAKCKGETRN